MKIKKEELLQIKKTKSVLMYGNENAVYLRIENIGMSIPLSKAFQVKRGLESYIQRFYRLRKKR